jgi:hypothetical protein
MACCAELRQATADGDWRGMDAYRADGCCEVAVDPAADRHAQERAIAFCTPWGPPMPIALGQVRTERSPGRERQQDQTTRR